MISDFQNSKFNFNFYSDFKKNIFNEYMNSHLYLINKDENVIGVLIVKRRLKEINYLPSNESISIFKLLYILDKNFYISGYQLSLNYNKIDVISLKKYFPIKVVENMIYMKRSGDLYLDNIIDFHELSYENNDLLVSRNMKINNEEMVRVVLQNKIFNNVKDRNELRIEEVNLEEKNSRFVRIDTLSIDNPDTGIPEDKVVKTEMKLDQVYTLRVKEDWFFDRQRSVMDVRILGICPVMQLLDKEGNFKAWSPMFWIYFPDARSIFAKTELFNTHNDTERRTYDDIFWKRAFASYIIKQSNVYDRKIDTYKTGLDALLEAEKIKDGIFSMEHDLWEL